MKQYREANHMMFYFLISTSYKKSFYMTLYASEELHNRSAHLACDLSTLGRLRLYNLNAEYSGSERGAYLSDYISI